MYLYDPLLGVENQSSVLTRDMVEIGAGLYLTVAGGVTIIIGSLLGLRWLPPGTKPQVFSLSICKNTDRAESLVCDGT